MNFRKNRESRGLLIYSEPHTKVKKVSDKKKPLPKGVELTVKETPVPKLSDFTEGVLIVTKINQ